MDTVWGVQEDQNPCTSTLAPPWKYLGDCFLVLLQKAFDSSLGVDKLLFSSKKRMTLGADLHPDVLLCGTDLYLVTACAPDLRLKDFGVNTFFHWPYLQKQNKGAPMEQGPIRRITLVGYSVYSTFQAL